MSKQSTLPTSPHIDLQELADGVYAAVSAPYGAARSNSGIVDLGDRTLLLDTTLSPNASRDLLAAAKELTGNPVSIVVISHCHADHVVGNFGIPAEVSIISTLRTRELCMERLPERLKNHKDYSFAALSDSKRELDEAKTEEEREECAANLRAWELMTDGLEAVENRYPDQTFETAIAFHGSKRSVEVMTHGGGHSPSDAFLWLPDERIVFTADLLFNGRHPWVGDGNPSEWIEILDKIKALNPQVWIPGHGAVTDVETATLMQRYMQAVNTAIADAVTSGLSGDEAAETPSPSEFEALDNPHMFGNNIRALLERETA